MKIKLEPTLGSKKITIGILIFFVLLITYISSLPTSEPEPEYMVSNLTIAKIYGKINKLEKKVKKLEDTMKRLKTYHINKGKK